MKKVEGSFEVNLTPAKDEQDVGRMLLDKSYSGPLSGKAYGQMLSHRTQVQGSAAYVALEHFTGTLEGREGSFSMYHKGVMNHGDSSLEVGIIPGSGTAELEGIEGQMDIIIEGGKHSYVLQYRVEKASK